VQPSECGEYEPSDNIDLLIHRGWCIGIIPIVGLPIDVEYPEYRDEVEDQLEAEAKFSIAIFNISLFQK
jgi:dTDP-glucose pyrophosphorylase